MSQKLAADFLGKPRLDYDAWRDLLQTDLLQKMCGRYNPEGIEPNAFTGWIWPIEVCGFKALETGCNAGRIERDYRDARLDGADHYFVLFPLRGQSLITQNEQATRLAAGDVVLVDSEIAYACGFRDYTHFAGKFRHRFGHPPGAHLATHGLAGSATVRSDADELTLSAHDPESLPI